ncbi:MAG: putative sensor domain DACNV-containing protein, partial [Luteolibacter sp.]
MNQNTSSSPGLTLLDLVSQLHGLLRNHDEAPSEEHLRKVCDVLYASSLLKEEGRAVRTRVIIAPPDAFVPSEGPPDGIHAIRFSTPHNLTANEIKRLSPAASFFHSVVAIWPDRD